MLKKLLVLLVCFMMAAMMLYGCAPAAQPSESTPAAQSSEPAVQSSTPAAQPSEAAPAESKNNNDDLYGTGLGTDLGFGPVGFDLDGLVARMGDKVKGLKIGISTQEQTEDWQINWVKYISECCEKYGMEVVVADATNDTLKQAEDLKALVSQDVDGICYFPVEEKASINPLTEVWNGGEGVPVVPAIPVPGADIPAWLAVDQEAKGQYACEYLQKLVGDKESNVLIINLSGTSDILNQRIDGFKKAAEATTNIKVVKEIRGDDYNDFLQKTIDTLNADENIDAIFGSHGTATLAAGQAAKQLNRPELNVVGIDTDVNILTLVRDGWIDGAHPQWPQVNGSLTLFTLLRVINGDEFEPPMWEPYEYTSQFADKDTAVQFCKIMWGKDISK